MTTATILQVSLPWPPKELSPNARLHWAKKAKAVKAYRKTCRVFAITAQLSKAMLPPLPPRLRVAFAFMPPDRRHHDKDNLLARMKACADGIADALGVNDNCFSYEEPTIGMPVPGGEVLVTVTGETKEQP